MNQQDRAIGDYKTPVAQDGWDNAVEVTSNVPEPLEPRLCDGKDCLVQFVPTWPTQRRCMRCRKEDRPYKSPDSPF